VPKPSSQRTQSSTPRESPCTPRKKQKKHVKTGRSVGRGPAVGAQPVQHLPAESASILQQEGQAKIFPRGRPCASANPANSRPAQALGPLGRPLRRQQGTRQRLLLLDRRAKTKSTQERRLRQGVGATMERKPPKTILQLKSSMYHAPLLY